jgi:hypothetical protein
VLRVKGMYAMSDLLRGVRNPLTSVSMKILQICALLRYAASSGNPLPTFRDKVSVPSSRVKKS